MQTVELNPLLTFKETMNYLKISRSTLLRLKASGRLPGHKIGNTWRFYVSDIQGCIEQKIAS